jgi:hypothetical protein
MVRASGHCLPRANLPDLRLEDPGSWSQGSHGGRTVVALALYRNASQERNRANRQTMIAASINRFLATICWVAAILFRVGPRRRPWLRLSSRLSPDIDRQFQTDPEVAAQLHHAIAKALDNRTDYAAARKEYEHAANLFTTAHGPLAEEAVVVRLQQAAMEARTYSEGSLARAKTMLAEEEARFPRLKAPRADLTVWLSSAKGMIALIDNDAKQAAEQFELAYQKSKVLPAFDEMAQLTLRQRMHSPISGWVTAPKPKSCFAS